MSRADKSLSSGYAKFCFFSANSFFVIFESKQFSNVATQQTHSRWKNQQISYPQAGIIMHPSRIEEVPFPTDQRRESERRKVRFCVTCELLAIGGGSGQSLTVYATEERKQIAREIRLAAKKEKKKIKADAKRQRKQNAILHRRAVSR